MKLKQGKEEIVYLLTQVFAKYEKTTGHEVRRNTNRKNYEDLARLLSEISNRLPQTAAELAHDEYAPDRNKQNLTYPNLKYDITGGQIKDACNGMVSSPRPYLVDACYIYLFGLGRKGFEKNPKDRNLIEKKNSPEKHQSPNSRPGILSGVNVWMLTTILLGLICAVSIFCYLRSSNKLNELTTDMKIGVYTPTADDIKKLEGTWLVYIGSPQARRTEKNRYHLVVTNIIDVKYKKGYFVFKRYGANFNHNGYMQYESKNIVSVHSYVSNAKDTIESPRLSLMRMDGHKKLISVISASWNFDAGRYNDLIGIREVYVKQSNAGTTEEMINTIENSSCKCKIVWLQPPNSSPKKYLLKNIPLDSLPDPQLRKLLDENSILLREPDSVTVITDKNRNL